MMPYYDDGTCVIYHGDARDVGDLTADVIVTDPPYGLAFMGKAWDRVNQQFHQDWATAAFGALPPGGWLLAFGGTRTWHRLACGIEDAGFEVRDTLMWLYGQGWPKSKATLKPGWEPILLARKPGSGVLQIDACRVTASPGDYDHPSNDLGRRDDETDWRFHARKVPPHTAGRWPANVVLTHVGGPEGCQPVGTRKVKSAGWNLSAPVAKKLGRSVYAQDAYSQNMMSAERTTHADPDGTETVEAWECEPDCPVFLLDQQSGERGLGRSDWARSDSSERQSGFGMTRRGAVPGYADSGGSSRFYYTAKAGPAERVKVDGHGHPTVKPLALMRWLVRLVTPPGGTVLDPFCGSGSTLVAAALEGRKAVGVEADERWCEGAARRCRERPAIQEVLPLEAR